MTPEQFNELAQQGYNRIPLIREILADLETLRTLLVAITTKVGTLDESDRSVFANLHL